MITYAAIKQLERYIQRSQQRCELLLKLATSDCEHAEWAFRVIDKHGETHNMDTEFYEILWELTSLILAGCEIVRVDA